MNKAIPLIDKIKELIDSEDKKRLLENFFSLSILQVANYILPLITLPYLVRVLGPEKFGLIAFAQAFIQYLVILTDYGFNLSATREISIYRDNKEKISEIFSSVMITKFGLMIISLLILSVLVFTIPKFKNDWLVYFFTFGMVLGNVLFPIWFFQGMERMKYITILNIVAKGIFTICIFIFIRKMADYLYVPLINSTGFLVAGGLSLRIVSKDFGIKFMLPSFKAIKHQLKEGWHIFISTVAISLYTTSNTFILGLFTNNTIVGYYAAAEKIMRAVQGLLVPISQTVYPHISKLVSESKEKALNFIRKLVKIVGSISFIISLSIFIFANLIVNIVLGLQYRQSIIVLRILAFLPFIIGLSNIFGIQTMLTFNLKQAFSKILISAGLLNIVLALILAPLYQHIGISIAVLTTEIFVTLSMFFYLKRKGIKIFAETFNYERT
ncbi:MAG TPA: flippase [Candidatus Desulfofervidus auxilii]|uniref:Flippase n=1 Tax=Desulfofervidus auxilii TaxID=1621989 RepID=A0A7C0Y5Z1_DESA2|nr:flippase [Candidatus Desulfofervidus auxilii]